VEEIVAAAAAHPSRIAIVTGGEPLLHQLDPLTTALRAAGFQTHIETSGSSPMSGAWDWVCLSPKKFKAPLPESVKAANELKVVVFNKSDFDWANSFVNDVAVDCKKYLQPEWEKSDAMTPLVIEYIKHNPSWELSAQLHKYIQVP
jgi:organic radical activating enzyme